MSRYSIVYMESTNVLRLSGLQDQAGNFVNDATVTLEEILTVDGKVAVGGLTVPVTLVYVTSSDGVYEAKLATSVQFVESQQYDAKVKAVASNGDQATWKERIRALYAQS